MNRFKMPLLIAFALPLRARSFLAGEHFARGDVVDGIHDAGSLRAQIDSLVAIHTASLQPIKPVQSHT